MSEHNMSQFAVIGLGRFGLAASIELMRLGNSVIGVDSDSKLVNTVSEQLTVAAIADATDESSLKELDIGSCDAVLVAIGESLEASILCVLLLKSLNVKEIWVKATTKPHHIILTKLGVSRIIHPEEEIGVRVAQSLNYPMMNQYMSIGNGLFIVEVEIKSHHPDMSVKKLLGKAGKDIEPMLVRRNSTIIKHLDGDFQLAVKDSLILSGSLTALKKIAPEFYAK
jgi:trk system potassium uptake protein TrkA